LGENRTETETSVLTGSKSVLTCRNGLTEDVADSLKDHFRSAEQRERRLSKHCGWADAARGKVTIVGVFETACPRQ